MKPVAEAAKINKAAGYQPKLPQQAPAPAAGVGSEVKADMKGALGGATAELNRQHPIPYHDHGPHHGYDHHIRHEPLHGLKPSR